MKKVTLILGGIILLLAVLAFVFSDQLSFMNDEVKNYQVGEAIQIGDTTMSVNDIEVMTADDDTSIGEGEVKVNLGLAFENAGDEDLYIVSPAMMYVLDEDGNKYRTAKAVISEGAAEKVDGPLPANSQKEGWVAFDVEDDADGLFLRYWPDQLGVSDTEIRVDLGL